MPAYRPDPAARADPSSPPRRTGHPGIPAQHRRILRTPDGVSKVGRSASRPPWRAPGRTGQPIGRGDGATRLPDRRPRLPRRAGRADPSVTLPESTAADLAAIRRRGQIRPGLPGRLSRPSRNRSRSDRAATPRPARVESCSGSAPAAPRSGQRSSAVCCWSRCSAPGWQPGRWRRATPIPMTSSSPRSTNRARTSPRPSCRVRPTGRKCHLHHLRGPVGGQPGGPGWPSAAAQTRSANSASVGQPPPTAQVIPSPTGRRRPISARRPFPRCRPAIPDSAGRQRLSVSPGTDTGQPSQPRTVNRTRLRRTGSRPTTSSQAG